MGTTNKLIRHAILPEQGVGFYEMPSVFPFPETSVGGVLVYDANAQLHGLILDAETGLWYDITTRDGAAGYGLTKYWTDKNGDEYDREVLFKEHVSESEEKPLRLMLGHLFIRPTRETKRDQTGYDSKGYPTGMVIDLDLYADGEPTTPTTTIKDIPENGDLKTDRKVEGHRVQIGLRSNRGAHKIINRKMEYVSSDRAAPPDLRISSEMGFQETLADVINWIGVCEGRIINRVTGKAVTTPPTAIVAGPMSIPGIAIEFNQVIDAYTFISTEVVELLFWANDNFIISYEKETHEIIIPTAIYQIGDWGLYRVGNISGTPGSKLTISPQDVGGGYRKICDIRVFSAVLSADVLEYYYNDVLNNAGGIVLP